MSRYRISLYTLAFVLLGVCVSAWILIHHEYMERDTLGSREVSGYPIVIEGGNGHLVHYIVGASSVRHTVQLRNASADTVVLGTADTACTCAAIEVASGVIPPYGELDIVITIGTLPTDLATVKHEVILRYGTNGESLSVTLTLVPATIEKMSSSSPAIFMIFPLADDSATTEVKVIAPPRCNEINKPITITFHECSGLVADVQMTRSVSEGVLYTLSIKGSASCVMSAAGAKMIIRCHNEELSIPVFVELK